MRPALVPLGFVQPGLRQEDRMAWKTAPREAGATGARQSVHILHTQPVWSKSCASSGASVAAQADRLLWHMSASGAGASQQGGWKQEWVMRFQTLYARLDKPERFTRTNLPKNNWCYIILDIGKIVKNIESSITWIFKKTNLSKHCFYLTHILYNILIHHAFFLLSFFLVSVWILERPRN